MSLKAWDAKGNKKIFIASQGQELIYNEWILSSWHLSPMSSLVQRLAYETTWRCQKNPFIGALGIQEPVIPGEPLFKG